MITDYNYLQNESWAYEFNTKLDSESTLVLVFSNLNLSEVQPYINQILDIFPQSVMTGCSTAGQFLQGELLNSTVLVIIIQFEKTAIRQFCTEVTSAGMSFEAGMELADELKQSDQLQSVLILSKGLEINGSQLIEGLNTQLDKNIIISGGMAGDNESFQQTWTIDNSSRPNPNNITALGFYGENLSVSTSYKGGWDMIGVDRIVTKAQNNILYEIDNIPALDLYKQYLGKFAKGLPSSGLFFPLAVVDSDNPFVYKIRTLLAIDEKDNSMTFAGDIPNGSIVRLMHADSDRLIDGAIAASDQIEYNNLASAFLLSVSCVGRKMVLGQRAEEETESIQNRIPKNCLQAGFYSYGEFSQQPDKVCELHNQTMTLSYLWEK
ncbi:MAG: FIST C-terminal domain-containing protein [Xanthomonadales bacterium]|nr:FIST C-terminal domain-containing protein [Xanthomonadales bacterium]